MKQWQTATIEAQGGRCLICNAVIDGEHGSWDHFVPRVALASKGASSLRVGLTFWTHGKCNSRRQHAPAAPPMIARARNAISKLPHNFRKEAEANIARVYAAHEAYLDTLAELDR